MIILESMGNQICEEFMDKTIKADWNLLVSRLMFTGPIVF